MCSVSTIPFNEIDPISDTKEKSRVKSSKDVLMMLTAWSNNQFKEFLEMK